MDIKTGSLTQALNTVKPGLDKGSMVYFTGTHLVAGNDQIVVHFPFPTDFVGGVNADDLIKLMDAVTIPDMSIDKENNDFVIDSGNVAGGLKMVDVVDQFSLPQDCKWEKLPDDFIKALKLCAFSASTDQTMGLLTCLKIDKSNVISSDNFRVSKYTFAKEIKNSFLLTLPVVVSLTKFKPVKVCQDQAFVHFELSGKDYSQAIFSCRKAVGEYPDVDDLFDVTGDTFELPTQLRDAVKSVEFLADNENPYDRFVTIKSLGGKVSVSAENDRGWSTYLLPEDIEKEINFKINPLFLYEILGTVTEITLGDDKALFETNNFKHVMALPE